MKLFLIFYTYLENLFVAIVIMFLTNLLTIITYLRTEIINQIIIS